MHISWIKALATKMTSLELLTLYAEIDRVYKSGAVAPSRGLIFNAFERPVHLTKVVILGQDPYPNISHACGLAFAVPREVNQNDYPRSLQRIIREMHRDVGSRSNVLGSYHYEQGVMLLNTALTVYQGDPGSQLDMWKGFTEKVIQILNEKDKLVWMLWGRKAQAYQKMITNPTHSVLTAGHPSPQSKDRFSGCEHFSLANSLLKLKGFKPIQW